MNLGVIQGRLSQPLEGFQETPKKWKQEFENLNSLGLNHIEWVITKNCFKNNPFFKEDLKSYPIYTVCADNLVDNNIDKLEYVSNILRPICNMALKNEVKYVTIPLLEESCLIDSQKRKSFKEILFYFAKEYPTINFSLEAEMPVQMLKELLIDKNIYITYDTGNLTSCGFDHSEYIEHIYDKISNVHLKDRTKDGKTVVPSTGNTEFDVIFKKLKEKNYQNVYTLQTAREQQGQELLTIKKHIQTLRGIYEKCI